jgi:hypothetical protein
LQRILDTARDDIEDHKKWQVEVLEALSKENLTAEPLQKAFRRSAIVRDRLLEELKGIEWMRAVSSESSKKDKSF